jgi:hypothetical protein
MRRVSLAGCNNLVNWTCVSELSFNRVQLRQQNIQALHTALGEVASARRCIIRGCGGPSDFRGNAAFYFLCVPPKLAPPRRLLPFPPASASPRVSVSAEILKLGITVPDSFRSQGQALPPPNMLLGMSDESTERICMCLLATTCWTLFAGHLLDTGRVSHLQGHPEAIF